MPFPLPSSPSLAPCGVLGVVAGEAGFQKPGVRSKAHVVTRGSAFSPNSLPLPSGCDQRADFKPLYGKCHTLFCSHHLK